MNLGVLYFCCFFSFGICRTLNTTEELITKMRANVLFSYSAYCNPKFIEEWTCFWCLKSKIAPVDVLARYYEPFQSLYYIGVIDDGKTLLVSYRGTPNPAHSIIDWVRDFDFASVPLENAPENVTVHKGFHTYFVESNFRTFVVEDVLSYLQKYSSAIERVSITGHSLGSTSAVLTLITLLQNGDERFMKYAQRGDVELMTFGSPRVGNDAFQSYFESIFPREKNFRVVNQRDVVPGLPPHSFFYWHVPTEYWFQNNTSTFVECDGSGEDPKCSNSQGKWSIPDHTWYLGYYLLDAQQDPNWCW